MPGGSGGRQDVSGDELRLLANKAEQASTDVASVRNRVQDVLNGVDRRGWNAGALDDQWARTRFGLTGLTQHLADNRAELIERAAEADALNTPLQQSPSTLLGADGLPFGLTLPGGMTLPSFDGVRQDLQQMSGTLVDELESIFAQPVATTDGQSAPQTDAASMFIESQRIQVAGDQALGVAIVGGAGAVLSTVNDYTPTTIMAREVVGVDQVGREYAAGGGPQAEAELFNLVARRDSGEQGLEPRIQALDDYLNSINGSGQPYGQVIQDAARRDPNLPAVEATFGVTGSLIAAPLAVEGAPLAAKAIATALDPAPQLLNAAGGAVMRAGGTLTRVADDALGTGADLLSDVGRRLGLGESVVDAVADAPVTRPMLTAERHPTLTAYEFNMVNNPGPLAEWAGSNPAGTFAGGRYDVVRLTEDTILYRGGSAGGGRAAFGQWFSATSSESAAQIRIEQAVKQQWIDATTGASTGQSFIEAEYAIRIPAGTVVYVGPTSYQSGIYLGGATQVFVPQPWRLDGVVVVSERPLP